jgi:cytochrome c biogenesis protein CcmG, thiol:disulfide interchange protein DsbE
VTAARARVAAQALALAGVAALLALLVWKVAFGAGGGVAEDLAAGRVARAPAFTLERLDREGTLSLSDLAGKPLVVNFWASWCIPCRDEAPRLQETYERYRGRGLVVLGVDFQDFRGDAKRFIKRFGVTYPNVYDGKGSLVGKWGLRGVPETFFVDRGGNVVGEQIIGGVHLERNADAFEEGIRLALGNAQ